YGQKKRCPRKPTIACPGIQPYHCAGRAKETTKEMASNHSHRSQIWKKASFFNGSASNPPEAKMEAHRGPCPKNRTHGPPREARGLQEDPLQVSVGRIRSGRMAFGGSFPHPSDLVRSGFDRPCHLLARVNSPLVPRHSCRDGCDYVHHQPMCVQPCR